MKLCMDIMPFDSTLLHFFISAAVCNIRVTDLRTFEVEVPLQ
jgi:hypothetical protein